MCGESAALTKAPGVHCGLRGRRARPGSLAGAIALAALPAELKLELALLSMRYMSHRPHHVANRIRETRCVSTRCLFRSPPSRHWVSRRCEDAITGVRSLLVLCSSAASRLRTGRCRRERVDEDRHECMDQSRGRRSSRPVSGGGMRGPG